MGDLLLVTGPPGAGKSTVAALLAASFDPSVLVSGDAFFGFIARGAITPWASVAGHQNEVCTAAAGAACGRYAAGGYTAVFDGMVGPWFLPQFLAATGRTELQYVIVLPPEDVVVERVRTRRDHGFRDEPATRHMYGEFARAAADPRHVVTAGGDADHIAALIRTRLAAGMLRYRAV